MKEHLNIYIKGKVKDIDFIYYSEIKANEFSLNGFIQNGSKTDVYLELEGEKENLDQFIDYIKQGPLSRNTDDLTVEKGELKDFKRFYKKKEHLKVPLKRNSIFNKFFRSK